jgi:subtilisin-like proprotein convertase family protein
VDWDGLVKIVSLPDKTRDAKQSKKVIKQTTKKKPVRVAVEHPFGYFRKKLKVTLAAAKTKSRNALRFDM